MADKPTTNGPQQGDPEHADGIAHRAALLAEGLGNRGAAYLKNMLNAKAADRIDSESQAIDGQNQQQQALDGGVALKNMMAIETTKGSMTLSWNNPDRPGVGVVLDEGDTHLSGRVTPPNAGATNKTAVDTLLADFKKARADGFISNSEAEQLRNDAKAVLSGQLEIPQTPSSATSQANGKVSPTR